MKGNYGSFGYQSLWSRRHSRHNNSAGGRSAVRVITRGDDPDHRHAQDDPGSFVYSDNCVSTGRYSLLTFLPRSLLEQFRRVANLYFLLISVLMLLGKYTKLFDSPLTPWSTLLVLVLVLLVSMGKEGVEDHKRHRADWETNRRLVQRMSRSSDSYHQQQEPLFQDVQWQHISVGDIVKFESGSELPADVVLLATSESTGLAYIETSNIDGETNLKAKSSVRGDSSTVPSLKNQNYNQQQTGPRAIWSRPDELQDVALRLECEPPNSIIHHFNGTLYLQGRENSLPVDASSLLLRGSSLKNTRWAVGLVVYTGRETKIVMNSRQTPSKLSSIERTMNNLIYLIFAAQLLISAISLVFFILWKNRYYTSLDYLCYSAENSPNKLYQQGCKADSDFSNYGYYLTFFILYNNFLPISLYVTVEICNYFQAYFIEKDIALYDEVSNMPALARTSNMNSDLGMVEYVFSDKTGTLTDNVMRFRRCSIGGVVYGDAPLVSIDNLGPGVTQARKQILGRSLAEIARRVRDLEGGNGAEQHSLLVDFVSIMAVCHTVVLDPETKELQSESPDEEALVKAGGLVGWTFSARNGGRVVLQRVPTANEDDYEAVGPADETTAATVTTVAVTSSSSPFTFAAEPVALSPIRSPPGTPVVVELPDIDPNSFRGGGESPVRQQLPTHDAVTPIRQSDALTFEGSLMAGVSTVLFPVSAFLSTTTGISQLSPADPTTPVRRLPGAPATRVEFEILATLPFDSTRKRMSVVVRRSNGSFCVFCKGADNVIYDRATKGGKSADQKSVMNRHLEIFAADGLRTLVLAKKELSAAQYEAFAAKWRAVEKAVLGRDELIREAAELIESDLTIVGASAIEDKLQDGVPQTILDLGNAGVKVWVLTGDKMETAINIGYSARLLGPKMVLIRLQDRGESSAQVKRKLRSLVSQFVRLTQNKGAMLRVWRSMRDSIRWALTRGAGPTGSTGTTKTGKSSDTFTSNPLFGGKGYAGSSMSGAESDVEAATLLESGGMGDGLHCPSVDQLTSDHLALIVDGETLLKIFGDSEGEKLFLAVATICKSVIACRVSPEQKRLMVRLVKRGVYPRPVTLSIGDGANDVAMIQEAQIGVGICGKEGRQAVNSSDFAIAQFRFLKRLMLVHGRTDYRRTCKVVLYSFYKNIVLTLVLFAYTFFSGYSGQSLFDDYIYSSYNVILAAPVVAFGVFDVDISDETLLKYSFLYVSGREGLDMNVPVLLKEMLQAILDAGLVFFIPYLCYVDPADTWSGSAAPVLSEQDAGKNAGIWVFGTTVFTVMVLAMFLRAAMLTYTWTWITHLCFWGSVFSYVAFLYGYQKLVGVSYNFYGAAEQMFAQPTFFWLCLLVPAGSLLIELAFRLVKREFFPSIVDISIEYDADARIGSHKRSGLLFESDPASASASVATGLAHSSNEFTADPATRQKKAAGTNTSPLRVMFRSHDDSNDDSSSNDEFGNGGDDSDVDDFSSAMGGGGGGEDVSGYFSEGSIGSVASESLEASLRYSSVVSRKRGKVPLDWQSVRALREGLSTHEQEALGLHEGTPRQEDWYNYDHASSEGYGPGAGSSATAKRISRATSRQRLRTEG